MYTHTMGIEALCLSWGYVSAVDVLTQLQVFSDKLSKYKADMTAVSAETFWLLITWCTIFMSQIVPVRGQRDPFIHWSDLHMAASWTSDVPLSVLSSGSFLRQEKPNTRTREWTFPASKAVSLVIQLGVCGGWGVHFPCSFFNLHSTHT